MRGKLLGGLKSAAPVALNFLMAAVLVSAERRLKGDGIGGEAVQEAEPDQLLLKLARFLWQPDDSSYQHVWPVNPRPDFFFVIFFSPSSIRSSSRQS